MAVASDPVFEELDGQFGNSSRNKSFCFIDDDSSPEVKDFERKIVFRKM